MIQAFEPIPPESLRKQADLFRRLAAVSRDAAAAERFLRWAECCESDAAAAAVAGSLDAQAMDGTAASRRPD